LITNDQADGFARPGRLTARKFFRFQVISYFGLIRPDPA
jgi:hypothetical protein